MILRLLYILFASGLVAAACGDSGGESDVEPDSANPPLSSERYPVADLDISYEHPERNATYQIGCQGDTATSGGDAAEFDIDPNQACEALADAALQRRLLDGPDQDRVCTQIFGGEDQATISGTIDGESFTTTFDRTDGCAIDDWDELAGPLLPVPYDPSTAGDMPDSATTTSTPDGDGDGDGEQGALQLSASCTNPDGFTIRYPSSWTTNDGSVTTPCSHFDPEAFDVPEATDERVAAITAYVDPVAFAEVAAPGATIDGTQAVTVVDGHQAVRLDGEFSGNQLYPDGTAVTHYLIDLSLGVDDGRGTLFVELVDRTGVDLDAARTILDTMVATIELDAETTDPGIVARYEGGGSPFTVLARAEDSPGGGVCLQIAASNGSSCVTLDPTAEGRSLRVVSLGNDLQPVLAGTAGGEVFRIEPRGDEGALPSYLPVPIDAIDGVRGWAFPYDRDRVNELVLYDIEGNEIGAKAVSGSDDEELEPVGRLRTEPIESAGFPASGRPLFLQDVRVGGHDGFDRVVFELAEGETVSYRVEMTETITQPSGAPADMKGEQLISVTLTPASTVDLSGEQVETIYTGPDEIVPERTETIAQVALVSDFEAMLTWGIGVSTEARFAVELLSDPLRLVVDIGR